MQDSLTIAQPLDAYIAVPELPPCARGSYISIADLEEVLTDYYAGQLNEPGLPELICQDLLEWHPNSLWCRVDSQQLDRLLQLLPPYQREALKFLFNQPYREELLQHQYTTHYQGAAEYWQFLDATAAAAVDYLCDLLLEDLNYAC